jgi:hypothetical protein
VEFFLLRLTATTSSDIAMEGARVQGSKHGAEGSNHLAS